MSESGSFTHRNKLKEICRLCAKAVNSKDSIRKEKLASVILQAFEIDIGKDNDWIHPASVCTSCRRKLDRFKEKYRSGRQKPDISIEPQLFTGHGPACTLCKSDIDFPLLERAGQQAGYVCTMKDSCLTLTKLSDDGTFISHYAVINKTGPSRLVVGCRDVSKHHLPSSDENVAECILERLTKWHVCPGNTGFADVIESKKEHTHITAVFTDVDRGSCEIAREESSDVVRHVNCQGFMKEPSGRCDVCTKYGSVLRKYRSRNAQKPTFNPSLSSHARNDLMSPTQLRAKVSLIQEDRQSLKRKFKSLHECFDHVIERDAVAMSEEISKDFSDILTSTPEVTENNLHKVFWEQQQQCLKRSKQGYRWHPAIVRLCIAIHAKSPGAYECLRKSGVVELPSKRTLIDYTFFTKPRPGFDPKVVQRIADDCQINTVPLAKRSVVLVFDEIHIRQGLVYAADSHELLGWTDLGDVNDEIQELSRGDKEPPLASHILCFMVRGLFLSLNQVFAFFPCTGFTSSQIVMTAWEAVLVLEQVGFMVRAMTCDGASANRKFYKLHGGGDGSLVHRAPHPTRENAQVYFMCDVPHLIKTTRNNWENSGWNSKSKHLEYNGQEIRWPQLLQLIDEWQPRESEEAQRPIALLRPAHKISKSHLHLTPSMRMKVKLASQVLSNSVKVAFQLSPTLSPKTQSTQLFIGMMDQFFDCLNVRRLGQDKKTRKPALAAYKDENDWRFKWLMDDFLGFLNDWETQSMEAPGLTKVQKSKRCLSKETLEGLRITVTSFVELSKELLREPGVEYILSAKFNQDPLEQYFSKQRSLGGQMENPDILQFGYNNIKLIVSGSAAVQAAAHGNTCPDDDSDSIAFQPIQRRKAKSM